MPLEGEGPTKNIDTEKALAEARAKAAVARERVERIRAQLATLETQAGKVIAARDQIKETKAVGAKTVSRRTVLKALTYGAAGLIFSGKAPSKVLDQGEPPVEKKERSREQKISERVAGCLRAMEIIENKEEANYRKVFENRYFISTLYYSEEAIGKMGPPHQNAAEEIIWNVHKKITKEFREKYINFLKETFEAEKELYPHAAHVFRTNKDTQSLPVDTLSWRGPQDNHVDAIDLFVAEGSLVRSMTNGMVVLSENGWSENDEFSTSSMRGGNSIIVFNPTTESFYRYAHMKRTVDMVSSTKPVWAGEEIGIVGHSGINASKRGHGNHVHFEINTYNRTRGVMVADHVVTLQRKLEAVVRQKSAKK